MPDRDGDGAASPAGPRTFTVHGLYVLPELTGPDLGIALAESGPRMNLRTTYVDTADLRLARDGVTLRYRTGAEGGWQLNLPTAQARAAGPTRIDAQGERDSITAEGTAGSVPAPLRELVTAWVRTAPLQPVAVLRTARDVHLLRAETGALIGELTDDLVSVLEGRRVVARFRELALWPHDLAPAVVTVLTERLLGAGAVAGQRLATAARALGPRAVAAPELSESTGPVAGTEPAALVVAQSLRGGTRRLLVHDAGVRLGRADAVHQMRVACRRMRSDLRTFGPLLDPQWAEGVRAELSWLADQLGAARDLEVLRHRLAQTAAADPLAPVDGAVLARLDLLLEAEQQGGIGTAVAALRSRRYLELLDRMVEAARNPLTTPAASVPGKEALPPLVATAWRDLTRQARKLRPDGADETWHTARIRAKRARYAAEAVAPALGKDARRLAAAATDVQELLGEHQDAAVAAERMLAIAADHPGDGPLSLLAGRLAERERAGVRNARARFPQLWKSLSRSRVDRWLPG